MIPIHNDRELRTAYQTLGVISKSELVSKTISDCVIETKRAIRAYLRHPPICTRILRQSQDSMLIVCPLPARLQTEEQANAYFMNHCFREAKPSAYDCTGCLFTSWFRIFRRDGQFWAYHNVCMDV